jgi:hypothetical protein
MKPPRGLLGTDQPSISANVASETAWLHAKVRADLANWTTIVEAVIAVAITVSVLWYFRKRDDITVTVVSVSLTWVVLALSLVARLAVRWLQAPGEILGKRLETANNAMTALEQRLSDFEDGKAVVSQVKLSLSETRSPTHFDLLAELVTRDETVIDGWIVQLAVGSDHRDFSGVVQSGFNWPADYKGQAQISFAYARSDRTWVGQARVVHLRGVDSRKRDIVFAPAAPSAMIQEWPDAIENQRQRDRTQDQYVAWVRQTQDVMARQDALLRRVFAPTVIEPGTGEVIVTGHPPTVVVGAAEVEALRVEAKATHNAFISLSRPGTRAGTLARVRAVSHIAGGPNSHPQEIQP